MKITNPIIEIQKAGLEVEDVLNGWKQWQNLLKDKGILTDENLSDLTNKIIENHILNNAVAVRALACTYD